MFGPSPKVSIDFGHGFLLCLSYSDSLLRLEEKRKIEVVSKSIDLSKWNYSKGHAKVNEKHYAQMFAALQRIRAYQPPERLKKHSAEDWGLDDGNEAVEYAYENVLQEAKIGLHGVRKPKQP